MAKTTEIWDGSRSPEFIAQALRDTAFMVESGYVQGVRFVWNMDDDPDTPEVM